MKESIYKIGKCVAFLLVLALVLQGISFVCIPSELIQEEIVLFEEQPEDSIDIAFIGSSTVFRYFSVMEVWNTYGITSMSYAASAMPSDFTISMMELAQDYHDPEVYVIDLRSVLSDEYRYKYYGTTGDSDDVDATINAFNLLQNPITKVNAVLNSIYVSDGQYMQIFSLLYNHEGFLDGVSNLIANGGMYESLDYKGDEQLIFQVVDMTYKYVDFEQMEEDETYTLTDTTVEYMIELFEYCDANDIQAYFIFSPYVNARNDLDQEIRRELGELVETYGYPFTDYRSQLEDIGLDITIDFYNSSHVNAVGAKKFTIYAMEDILDTYEIVPDYSQEVVEDWDAEYVLWESYYEENVADLYE